MPASKEDQVVGQKCYDALSRCPVSFEKNARYSRLLKKRGVEFETLKPFTLKAISTKIREMPQGNRM